ncbi:E Granule Component [Caenorhabditis elegans]|uniref:Uncharacterized protein n=1 Tax=Caenorhabditis elegans TaxID=6239 RepID=A7LPD5_CAEEL|nr:Uncharacterized protein CELE_F59G1.8 [Caenorhabditis elegans]CCD70159.1 Uncharacterized protein CELE_F59G1.8 [Caenorhabditis elegans]|eukprot:NP_001122617.2 Uncharacterized protein CELE_F59G1.8 [Caenorhabditis elegans]
MDWQNRVPTKLEPRNGMLPNVKREQIDEMKFPEAESWWNRTDTRQKWDEPPRKAEVNVDRCENLPSVQTRTERIDESRKEDEYCEVVVSTKKTYYSRRNGMKPGTLKNLRCYYQSAGIPLQLYVNCSPDRFQTLNKYCDGVLLNEDFNEDNRNESEVIETRITETKQIGDGQYEVRIESRYKFLKTAKVSFYVAMHSESAE